RSHREVSLIAEAPEGVGNLVRKALDQADVKGAYGRKISLIGVIGTLAHIDSADKLRNEEIEVRVALAVRVSAHVDRHVVDRDRKIRTVVEVVAAQEILVGFALTAMLGHDEPRYYFQHFARARHRPRRDVCSGEAHFARS